MKKITLLIYAIIINIVCHLLIIILLLNIRVEKIKFYTVNKNIYLKMCKKKSKLFKIMSVQ